MNDNCACDKDDYIEQLEMLEHDLDEIDKKGYFVSWKLVKKDLGLK
jgi:hypothetical protein